MRNLRQHFSEEFESFKELNKEGKLGVSMVIGGIAMIGVNLVESGFAQYYDFTKTNELTTWSSSMVIFGFVIASHGHKRQTRNEEIEPDIINTDGED